MLAMYMPIMFDSNLEIRISVSSCHTQKTESNLQAKRKSGRYLNVHEAMEVNDPSCPFLQVEEHQDFLL